MNFTKSIEDYLEAILITKIEYGRSKAVDIAEFLNVSKPAVTKAMKHLIESGYVVKENSNLELTKKGKEIADSVYDKHNTLEKFLLSLGISPETAKTDCCKMEHIISEETFSAIKKFLEKK